MVKKIVDNRKVDFNKIAKKVKAQVQKALKPNKFVKNRKSMGESLQKAVEFGLAKVPEHK